MPAVANVQNLDAMEVQRRACSELSFGLSDSFSSPRSMPASPDAAFVVTPEGKALLAAMELQVDEKGHLHVVDVPIRVLQLDGDEPKITPVTLPVEPQNPFATPVAGLSGTPPLKLGWEPQPLLPWRKAFHEDIKEQRAHPTTHAKKTEVILEVDDDGVSHVHEVPCRVAAHKRNLESDSVCFVGDEEGNVHHAHTVVISCPDDCECVITRPDDDQSGIFDTVRTPHEIKFNYNHPLIIIGEVDGPSHVGTSIMICDSNGEVRTYARVSTLPKFTAPTTKLVTYQTPKLLCWHSSGSAIYKRVLLGREDQVICGYVSIPHPGTLVVTEDGANLKYIPTVALPQKPKHCDITYLSDENGVNHTGITVLRDSPCGLVKVSVECQENDEVTVTEVKGMRKFMSTPGHANIAGLTPKSRLLVEFPDRKMICAPVYYKELPISDPATRRGLVKVCICDECGPVHFMIRPQKDCTEHQVIISDGNTLRVGLNIMYDSPVGIVIKSRI